MERLPPGERPLPHDEGRRTEDESVPTAPSVVRLASNHVFAGGVFEGASLVDVAGVGPLDPVLVAVYVRHVARGAGIVVGVLRAIGNGRADGAANHPTDGGPSRGADRAAGTAHYGAGDGAGKRAGIGLRLTQAVLVTVRC